MPITEEDQKRIKLLRRQQERKNKIPYYIQNLSTIYGNTISEDFIISLEEIDRNTEERNSSGFNSLYLNLTFPIIEKNKIESILSSLNSYLSKINFLSLSHTSDLIVLKINTDFIINSFEKLIDYDRDAVFVHDINLKNGLWIDLFEELYTFEGVTKLMPLYELRIFGKQWIKIISENI